MAAKVEIRATRMLEWVHRLGVVGRGPELQRQKELRSGLKELRRCPGQLAASQGSMV